MSDLSPGQEVTVSPSGITAEVLYVRGDMVDALIRAIGGQS